MAICPSSFERLMRRPADVGAIDSQPRVVAFNATCALVLIGNKTPSTRPSGRSAHEIIARAIKISGAAKSLVISPCRTYDAAAPLSSKKNSGVRPLLQPRQTRSDDDRGAEELPDSQNAENVHGVAQMRDDPDDRRAGDELRRYPVCD